MDSFNCLTDALRAAAHAKKDGGAAANKNRTTKIESILQVCENPPSSMNDSPAEIAFNEEELLGISITCSKIDSCDLSEVNTSCKEFLDGKTGFMLLGVEVSAIREIKTKKGKTPGKKMCFLTVRDSSCSLGDVVAFPEIWSESSSLLFEGNTVLIQGERGNEGALVIKKVFQAR